MRLNARHPLAVGEVLFLSQWRRKQIPGTPPGRCSWENFARLWSIDQKSKAQREDDTVRFEWRCLFVFMWMWTSFHWGDRMTLWTATSLMKFKYTNSQLEPFDGKHNKHQTLMIFFLESYIPSSYVNKILLLKFLSIVDWSVDVR